MEGLEAIGIWSIGRKVAPKSYGEGLFSEDHSWESMDVEGEGGLPKFLRVVLWLEKREKTERSFSHIEQRFQQTSAREKLSSA